MDRFPLELNEQIALYLNDKDLVAFNLVCQETYNAVNHDRSSVYRERFKSSFDMPGDISTSELRQKYQSRKSILRKNTVWQSGQTKKEREMLMLMKELALESYGPQKAGSNSTESLNIIRLYEIVKTSSFFDKLNFGNNTSPTRRQTRSGHQNMAVLQLLLSHWAFDPKLYLFTNSWNVSQKCVYEVPSSMPLFDQWDINLNLLLNLINFFRPHFLREKEFTLHKLYGDLGSQRQPSAWSHQLEEGILHLKGNFIGTFAYLDSSELQERRHQPAEAVVIPDELDLTRFDAFEFEFVDKHDPPMPQEWQDSLDSAIKTRPGRQTFFPEIAPFEALESGAINSNVYCRGRLQSLPAVWGIPGFQRFTMMKVILDDQGMYTDEDMWVYEGCVLPGNQMILGRWWSAVEGSDYSGPFILWNIDDEKLD